jgi:hypothetical protein
MMFFGRFLPLKIIWLCQGFLTDPNKSRFSLLFDEFLGVPP